MAHRRNEDELLTEKRQRSKETVARRLGDEGSIETRSLTAAVSASFVPVCNSSRTFGYVSWNFASRRGSRLALVLSKAPSRSTPEGDCPDTTVRASSARRSSLSAYASSDSPLGEKHKPLPVAKEQFRADGHFKPFYPGCHIRLHAVQLTRGSQDAALFGNGLKNLEIRQIHISPCRVARISGAANSQIENILLLLIHYSRTAFFCRMLPHESPGTT
jgi:hypothetical protein